MPPSEPSEPSVFRVLAPLFKVNPRFEGKFSTAVAFSCIGIGAPAPLALAYGDVRTFSFVCLATLCSFMGDYLYRGTIWDVIDRWVAASYTVYLSCLCFPRVPILTCLNIIPVSCILTWARKSKTWEQWVLRQSVWHAAMAVDVTFFLCCLYM
eukprot:gnl/TRDRNA2_/TRDRNA2_31723_c0_seq2.p1 gnl/TRDRNA2_/TRDRNA2_31723_c0~~gnl/TRDRNA2_/TRDRNA2_31723_c0_seq2.p1  ORF type:complete len:153 (-),score=7.51 gnl/TRDRNA2_/TRDRNA2_31723_c0_seq2:93-551(-)